MQNDALRNFLLSTGDKVLVEASSTDRVLGIGLGKNNPDALDPQKMERTKPLGFYFDGCLERYGYFGYVWRIRRGGRW